MTNSRSIAATTTILCLNLAAPAIAKGTFKTIYRFTGGADGLAPAGGPTVSNNLILFGTTSAGGKTCPPAPNPARGCGTIWRLNPDGTKQTIFSFNGTFNGYAPGTTLVKRGNRLYGTTSEGGSQERDRGTIFSIGVDGKKFEILHHFNLHGGNLPSEHTTFRFDATGNLFGTTFGGGKFGYGVLYELRSDGTYTVLHNFSGRARDGAFPDGLFMDKAGLLYGATQPTSTSGECYKSTAANPRDCGIVYSYDTTTETFKKLYSIRRYSDGLALYVGGKNEAGDLFGAASAGGTSGQGVLFVLRNANGNYIYHTLYDFTGKADGGTPSTPDVDVQGRITGTTALQSQSSKAVPGTLYSYKSGMFKTLFTFTGGADGSYPTGSPVVKENTVYGTAQQGGLPNCPSSGSAICGTVWTYMQSP